MTTPPVDVPKPASTKPAKTPTPKQPGRVAVLLSAWVPDPRWAHPVAAVLWVYLVAIAVTRPGYEVPPLLLGLVAPAGIVLSILRARRSWPEHDYGDDVAHSMAWLGAVASVMAAGVLVYAAMAGPWRALPYLLLAGVFCGGWYAVFRTSAPKIAKAIADEREAALIERATVTWQELLTASGLGLKVVETRPTRAGYVLGVESPNPNSPVGFDALQARMSDLTVRAAARLAQDGVKVSSGTIRAEETEVAHVHLIHVCTKHILRESIPYEPFEQAPGTIADPVDIGLYEDGQEVVVPFGGDFGGVNGLIVGATGSGKSVLTNVLIARTGECGDVLVGVVASSKLVPLVYPWIKPWLRGETKKPAIDFVAGQDPQQVLLMLAAIYKIVCSYNAALSNESTHTPTVTAPGVVLVVEEAGKMAARPEKVVTHDGLTVGFSQLVHMIDGECRSAQTSLLMLNQMALFNSFGDHGSEIQRNTPFRVCLKTMSFSDGTNTLPAISAARSDTTKLRHNSMLVQPSADEPRVMPAKAYDLRDEKIGPVAVRNAGWRPDLGDELVDEMGEVWTGRWDADRLPELVKAASRDGLAWPTGQVGRLVEDAVDAELRRMLEAETTPRQETPVTADQDTPTGMPDADAAIAELAEIASRPAITLPEPLHSVMSLLRDPGAPTDFVGTRQLAIMLDRVAADADDKELDRAADELTREMRAIDDELRTKQKRGGGERARGYDVTKLKEIASRIARKGGQ